MNYIRILSKSSLKSTSSSRKSLTPSDEISKLQTEIEILKDTVASFKISLENKDAAIGTLAREKEKIFVELKSSQRITRNMHQQLLDERDIHAKQKEYLVQEIERLTKNFENNGDPNVKLGNEEVNILRTELKNRDEVICDICSKYLKVKQSKIYLQKKLQKLHWQTQKTCHDIVMLLEDNRNTINDLLHKMIHASSVAPSNKKYLKLLKVNANLHYENVELKIHLTHENESFIDLDKHESEEISRREISHNNRVQDRDNTIKCTKSEDKLKKIESKITQRRYAICSKSNIYDCEPHKYSFLKSCRKLFNGSLKNSINRTHSDPCLNRFSNS